MALKMIWANNASTKLIKLLLPTDEIIYVEDPTRFPKPIFGEEYFMVTIEHPITHDFEICKVIKVEGNKFFVERAQEETNALEFPIGSIVENRVTKGTLELLRSSGSGLPTNRKPNQVLKVKKDNSVEFAYGQNIYSYEIDKINELKELLYSIIDEKFQIYYEQLEKSVSVEDFLENLEGFLSYYLYDDLDDIIDTIFNFDIYEEYMTWFYAENNILENFSLINSDNIKIFYQNFNFNINFETYYKFNDISNYNKIKKYLNNIYNLNKNEIKEIINFIKNLYKLFVNIMVCIIFQNNIDEEFFIYIFLNLFTNELYYEDDYGE